MDAASVTSAAAVLKDAKVKHIRAYRGGSVDLASLIVVLAERLQVAPAVSFENPPVILRLQRPLWCSVVHDDVAQSLPYAGGCNSHMQTGRCLLVCTLQRCALQRELTKHIMAEKPLQREQAPLAQARGKLQTAPAAVHSRCVSLHLLVTVLDKTKFGDQATDPLLPRCLSRRRSQLQIVVKGPSFPMSSDWAGYRLTPLACLAGIEETSAVVGQENVEPAAQDDPLAVPRSLLPSETINTNAPSLQPPSALGPALPAASGQVSSVATHASSDALVLCSSANLAATDATAAGRPAPSAGAAELVAAVPPIAATPVSRTALSNHSRSAAEIAIPTGPPLRISGQSSVSHGHKRWCEGS